MIGSGNIIAFGVLLLWPLISLVLFLTQPVHRAIVMTLIGAYLLLPVQVGFDLPAIPALDKASIPSVCAFLLALGLGGGGFRWIRSLPVNILMLTYVFGPLATWLTNRDPVTIGSLVMPGLTWYDGMSMMAEKAIDLMPFILGAGLMRREAAHRDILLVMVMGALAYSPLVLFEIAKTPFLAMRIYHIDPGAFWLQNMRDGGYRAMVFMGHGLEVSFFLGLSVLAAIGLWRARMRVLSVPPLLCAAYLFVVLVLNKTAGALALVLLLAPLLALLSARRIMTVALAVGLIIVTYPTLRASGLVPVDAIMSVSNSYSQERGESLSFRLRNEDILLARAHLRPWFGWGGYGRNRVFVINSWDRSVSDASTTDGTWIIIMGSFGWLGYISVFGLLCYPFFHLYRTRKRGVSLASAALVIMLLFNLIQLIPNSSLRPITWLIAGALAGLVRSPAVRRVAQGTADGPVKSEPEKVLTHA